MTTTSSPPTTHRLSVPGARRLALAGAAWTAAFAAVHGYWALGGRIGVPRHVAPIAQRPLFLFYDVGAGAVLAAAALIGLLLWRPTGGGPLRLRIVRWATFGAVLALVRGGLGVLQDMVGALAGSLPSSTGAVCDVWFTVAGVVFLVVARRLRETARIVSAR